MHLDERIRLVLPILAVSALLLLLGGVAAWYLHRSQRESSKLLSDSVSRLRAADELMLASEELQRSLDQFLLTGDRVHMQPIPDLGRQANEWIDRADAMAINDDEARLVDQVRQGYKHYLARLDELMHEPPDRSERQAAVEALDQILALEIFHPALKYRESNRQRVADVTERNQALADRMGIALLLLGCCGALAGLLAGFAIARGIQQQRLRNQRIMMRSEQLANLGRVAAGMAHELRNPLTSMKIIAQSATVQDDRAVMDRQDFSILEQEIGRLGDSIQAFLDYARPPRPHKQRCTVQSIVRQTVALVERRAAGMDVELKVVMPDEPIGMEADAGQLRQVMLNLLINALDASPGGGVVQVVARLAATCDDRLAGRRGTGSGRVIELEVIDSGMGLPQDLGDRIFEAFVSTKDTGTGLGLAICRRIIEDHGGDILARSAPDGGAVFTVRLPSPEDAPKAGAALPAVPEELRKA